MLKSPSNLLRVQNITVNVHYLIQETSTVVMEDEMVLFVEGALRDSQNLYFQPNARRLQNVTITGFGL